MFWNKEKKVIESEEYLKLKHQIAELSIRVETLELDLMLYKKKIKSPKIKEEEEKQDTENYFNGVIVKS